MASRTPICAGNYRPARRPPDSVTGGITMTTPTPASPAGAPATGRLGQGELRHKVAGFLAANHMAAWKPGEISHALGHSAGAVGNALATLEARGEATREPGRPIRYKANAATATATAPSRPPSRPRPARPATASAPAAAPAGSTTGTPAATPGGPVTGPNGKVYRPRALADMPDVDALRKLRAASIPVLLYGPPGTGKTSLAEAAFPDLITLAGDGDTTVADFVGDYTQTDDGRYEFVYGPLVTAMTDGRPLLIDDATLISPKVLAVVYPAMDGRRQITVKAHKGETITAAEGFYVIAGHNPGVHGAVLTDALASRFSVQIQVGTDFDLAHALKIDSRAIRVARNLATRHAAGEIGWAPQLRELIAFGKIAAVLGTEAAAANLAGIAPEEDRDVVLEVVATVFGRPVTPLALGRQI
jgi:nitric oxide reductase NorQ protein